MDKQIGRPVLVEFWDFCRVHSLRTLPYVQAWHERYGPLGLRVIGVHSPGFACSRDEDAVRTAVGQLGISHPVLVDPELEVWRLYDNAGWPARYLFDQRGMLFDYHYGEGGYTETERAIQELLGVDRAPLPALRPEDADGAMLVAPSEDRAGPWSGPYQAGGVWGVFSGRGEVVVNGEPLAVQGPAALALVEHPHHTHGSLDLEVGDGVVCHAVCFTPGLSPAPREGPRSSS